MGADPTTFDGTRTPLVATFKFGSEEVTLVNNHFTSLGGSQPLFGAFQPPAFGNADRRLAQAQAVNAFVTSLLASNADAQVAVIGDLNDFEFSPTLAALDGSDTGAQILTNQVLDVDVSEDRFTFNFEGNSQVLDHFLVTTTLDPITSFDIVQTNVGDAGAIASDHNPILGSIEFFSNDLVGTNGEDLLRATDADEFIEGLGGNDIIFAFAGDDVVKAGDGDDDVRADVGDDHVHGGAGADTLAGGGGDDAIDGGDDDDIVSGQAGDDLLAGGEGDDEVLGGAGNDTLTGGEGADTLSGGRGSDLYILGEGDDLIIDGAGRDIFQADAGFGDDLVLNFDPVRDSLDFSGFGVNGIADALPFAAEVDGATVFDFGGGDILTLDGVALAQLTDNNFVGNGVGADQMAADLQAQTLQQATSVSLANLFADGAGLLNVNSLDFYGQDEFGRNALMDINADFIFV